MMTSYRRKITCKYEKLDYCYDHLFHKFFAIEKFFRNFQCNLKLENDYLTILIFKGNTDEQIVEKSFKWDDNNFFRSFLHELIDNMAGGPGFHASSQV